MQIILNFLGGILQAGLALIALYIILVVAANAISTGWHRGRAKFPHVVNWNLNLNTKTPSISELKRRMMDEVEKKEEANPAATQ